VEIHLHLEGAIPLAALWEMVQRHGGDPATPAPEALAARFAYTDFAHFIETWVWKLRFHRTYDDYAWMAETVAADLVGQGIVHADLFVSPTDVAHHGLEPAPLLLAVRRGLDRVPGISVALVPDLVRDTGPTRAMQTLEVLLEVVGEAGIAGITIGGSEQRFPPEPFAPVYARAREAGLRLTAHAGEAAGPESVRAALDALGVERIGHGVRAVEDPALVARLVSERTPLEVCPTSNLRTGVARDWPTHPVRTLIDAGAVVTVSTDDPAMFGCDLAGEYAELMDRYGYGWDVVVRLATDAVESCWAPEDRKDEVRAQLAGWRRSHGL
jgi:adenosine deaminase